MQIFSSEDLKALGDVFHYQLVMTKLWHLLSSILAEAGGKKLRSTVQRSTETGLAVEMRNWMTRQASRESTDGSMNSYSSEGKWVRPARYEELFQPFPETIFFISLCFHKQFACFTVLSYFSQTNSLWRRTLLNFPCTSDLSGFLYSGK